MVPALASVQPTPIVPLLCRLANRSVSPVPLQEVFDRLATHLASRKDMRVEFGAIGQVRIRMHRRVPHHAHGRELFQPLRSPPSAPQLLNGGGRTAFEFSSAFLDQCGHRAAPLASAMAARPKSARPGGGVLVVRRPTLPSLPALPPSAARFSIPSPDQGRRQTQPALILPVASPSALALTRSPASQHNNPELNRFIKLCEAADKASAGMLSRAEAERILSRVPALVAGRDALSVLGMLEAASQRSGKLVKYLALASALLGALAAPWEALQPEGGMCLLRCRVFG